MSLTNNSDIYAAIHDEGINRVIRHLMRQRPSLFNYGTSFLASNPQLLCEKIDAAPEVIGGNNPLIKILDPLPVIGLPPIPPGTTTLPTDIIKTNLALNFAVQLSKGEIDFFEGNVFALPPGLTPLLNQRLAIHFKFCAGIGCPRELPNLIDSNKILVPPSELECFCLDLYATAECKIDGMVPNQKIKPKVDGIKIVDLRPEGLENAITCYAKLALNYGIFPPITEFVSKLAFGLFQLPPPTPGDIQVTGDIQLSGSTTVANNPAIEENQLKVFINLDKADLNIVVTEIPPLGGGGPTITRTVRPRTRAGTFDITTAISGETFTKIYNAFIKGFRLNLHDKGSWGIFSAEYKVSAHLENGTIEIRNNGSIEVRHMQVKWDILHLDIGIDIPTIPIGGFCLIPIPFDGCLLTAPEIDLFADNPDITIPLDLSGFITSRLTFSAFPKVFYGVGPGVPNRWQITMVPTLPIVLDIIDLSATIGDLFHNLVVKAIDNFLDSLGLPGWAKDFIESTLGGIEGIIRDFLNIPSDIAEFILDFIGNLGIFQTLIDALAKYIAITLFEVQDPLTILEADPSAPPAGPLIPVRMPIEFLGIRVNAPGNELIVEGDIGN
jgi:hypothetical protein